jgi:hypothetical protein
MIKIVVNVTRAWRALILIISRRHRLFRKHESLLKDQFTNGFLSDQLRVGSKFRPLNGCRLWRAASDSSYNRA